MAERVVVVCDVCGKAATETVTLKVRGRSLQKDLCQIHLTELSQGARQARRGRPRAKPSAAPTQTTPTRAAAPRRRSRKAAVA